MHVSRSLFAAALAGSLALLASLPQAASALARRPQDPLSADAAVGRVLDREGVAARRPVLADRWRPATEATRLQSGDWLRTGARGANALRLELASGAGLVLGPGGLLEVTDAARVTLSDGELEVVPAGGGVLEVAGPSGMRLELRERAVLRAHQGVLTRLSEEPRWLAGYRSDASSEALGSLLAKVDGRNVPLTVGYHKVTVDIRDQIARTVIEESFVNHTDHVLEGVFYFPLPADASISGFGMWIGDELVEADIVEKERAREIYETILREKRDPGLLEWTGGNLFKARVFPIGNEKRIRIAYTQVLPKERRQLPLPLRAAERAAAPAPAARSSGSRSTSARPSRWPRCARRSHACRVQAERARRARRVRGPGVQPRPRLRGASCARRRPRAA